MGFEVCPKCASKSASVYDRRKIRVKDAPIRGVGIILEIIKRRFFCKPCKKPFTEPVEGIAKSSRTTRRYERSVHWACENFADMQKVRRAYNCSNNYLYKARYSELERKSKEKQTTHWPKSIGVDEHGWKRNKLLGCTDFVTMVVDHKNKKLIDVVEGKTTADLKVALNHIQGKENVKNVTLDLCDPFAAFARDFFPNAKLVADKFHVLRLLTPHINRHRKLITGDKRTLPVRRLLLRNGKDLEYFKRQALWAWLSNYPELKELYSFKERMHGFYRINGYERASKAFRKMTDALAFSSLPELKRLRKTLLKWKHAILNYFSTGLTNARLEGFNNVAKTVKKRSYGIKSFKNYRLLLRNACC